MGDVKDDKLAELKQTYALAFARGLVADRDHAFEIALTAVEKAVRADERAKALTDVEFVLMSAECGGYVEFDVKRLAKVFAELRKETK